MGHWNLCRITLPRIMSNDIMKTEGKVNCHPASRFDCKPGLFSETNTGTGKKNPGYCIWFKRARGFRAPWTWIGAEKIRKRFIWIDWLSWAFRCFARRMVYGSSCHFWVHQAVYMQKPTQNLYHWHDSAIDENWRMGIWFTRRTQPEIRRFYSFW